MSKTSRIIEGMRDALAEAICWIGRLPGATRVIAHSLLLSAICIMAVLRQLSPERQALFLAHLNATIAAAREAAQ